MCYGWPLRMFSPEGSQPTKEARSTERCPVWPEQQTVPTVSWSEYSVPLLKAALRLLLLAISPFSMR